MNEDHRAGSILRGGEPGGKLRGIRRGGGEVDGLAGTRADILSRIADAAARGGRDPRHVNVIAVTKTVPPARIADAIAAGFTMLGENRVQERQAKASELEGTGGSWPADATGGTGPADASGAADASRPAGASEASARPQWHLVGPLQSNKARRAIELFDVIETVDSLDLAQRLSRLASEIRSSPLSVLLQVNVDDDAAKAGFDPASLERDLPAILDLPSIVVDGLMTVGRLVETAEAARPTFAALRSLSERLRVRYPALGPALSMGMSDDYPIAVEEGATLVRIGRSIFGARPTVR